MKRLFALSLTLLLLCSMASMALAVEFSHEMGGRFYGYFSTIDDDQGFNAGAGNDCYDTILAATVKEGNTWAKIAYKADTWGSAIHHALGIDNVGDTPLSLQFATYDTGTCNVGQQFMGDLFNDFKADPLFNTCDMKGAFSAKYITDSFEFKAEAKVYDGEGDTDNRYDWKANPDYDPVKNPNAAKEIKIADNYDEIYAAVMVFKPSDDSKFYVGAKHKSGSAEDFFVAGTELKIGDIGLKVDLWSDKGNYAGLGEIAGLLYDGQGYQALQATVDIGKTTGQLAVVQPESDFDNAIGLGAAYRLTEKLTLGTKYFMVDEAVCKDDLYDVYGMYKVGVFDIKVGTSNAQFLYGQGGSNNYGANGKSGTKLNEDGFLYAGLHFEF